MRKTMKEIYLDVFNSKKYQVFKSIKKFFVKFSNKDTQKGILSTYFMNYC